ncbi:hypothetical protein S40293_05933 [Stachybotrys chartarum IBT 40293]|nr:hypothetical protein S40293_05933 [Stachybotrys chartarum IBT 40293]
MASFAKPYEYEDISHESTRAETRMLTLHPGNFNDDIKISIERILLKDGPDQPEFAALSYHWGSSQTLDKVHVDQGGTIPITLNLFIALRYLRNADQDRKLWIDALCINQQSEEEKNYHVRWMGKVFEKASQVIVFLGHLAQGDSRAINNLVQIGKCIRPSWTEPSYTIIKNRKSFLRDNTPKLSSERIQEIDSIMSRPIFTRIWVIQELLLMKDPKRSILQCGGKSVCWDDFRKGYWVMATNPPRHITRPGSVLSASKLMSGSAHFICNPKYKVELSDVFYELTRFGCTEPVDRVFGILELLKKSDKQLQVTVDYSLPIEKVFEELQRQEIRRRGIHLLRFCEMGTKLLDSPGWHAPSWVPRAASDVSALCITKATPMLRFKDHAKLKEGGGLEIWGYRVGTVVKVWDCSHIGLAWSNGCGLNYILKHLHDLHTSGFFSNEVITAEKNILSAMDSLLLCQYSETTTNRKYLSRKDLREIISSFCLKQRSAAMNKEEPDDLRGVRSSLLLDQLDRTFRQPPMLFVSEDGRIGIGTRATSPKDEIYAIYGLASYMILRAENQEHHVVGPTCMAGEMAAEAILGPLPDEDIWLVYEHKRDRHVFKNRATNKYIHDPRLASYPPKLDPKTLSLKVGEVNVDFERWNVPAHPPRRLVLT